MIRAWPEYSYNFLLNANNFVKQGVSIVYFENDHDWRWKVSKLGDFLIPRTTPATEGKVEVAMAVRPCQPHELYKDISDPKTASAAGWNVKEVRKAIVEASEPSSSGSVMKNWEDWEIEYKNNDLCMGAKASTVDLLHCWVTEFDGTVSHFITLKNGENKDFLFKKIGRFGSVNEAFTFFTYGIGTNGYYHGIRGLGYKIFPHMQVSNRVRCSMIDGAVLSSSLLMQPSDDAAMDNLGLTYYGPFAVASPGMNVLKYNLPNFGQNVLPVINDMSQMVQNKVTGYSNNNLANDGRERSKFEVSAQLEQNARLSITALNLFYEPWQKLLKEMVRRIIATYPKALSGGEQVAELKARLEEQGVPMEALEQIDIDSVQAVRAVGAGSAAHRQLTQERLLEMSSSFDEVGRKNAVRDLTTTLVGPEKGARYTPAPEVGERTPMDAKFAGLENCHLADGELVPVYQDDTHILHLNTHLNALEDFDLQVEQGEMDIKEAVEPMAALHAHSTQHLEYISADPTLEAQTNAIRQILQQKGETIHNGIKAIQADQREANLAGEGQPAEGEEGQLDEVALKVEEHQVKLSILQEKAEQEMNIREAKAQQEMAITDAKSALALENNLQSNQ
jgi:hypothetical protein